MYHDKAHRMQVSIVGLCYTHGSYHAHISHISIYPYVSSDYSFLFRMLRKPCNGEGVSRTWQEGLAISGLQFARNLPNYTGKGFRTDACTSEAAIYVPGYTRPFR